MCPFFPLDVHALCIYEKILPQSTLWFAFVISFNASFLLCRPSFMQRSQKLIVSYRRWPKVPEQSQKNSKSKKNATILWSLWRYERLFQKEKHLLLCDECIGSTGWQHSKHVTRLVTCPWWRKYLVWRICQSIQVLWKYVLWRMVRSPSTILKKAQIYFMQLGDI